MQFVAGSFSDVFETPLGKELWAYLERETSLACLETTTFLGRPALEGLQPGLTQHFGERIESDRIKQLIYVDALLPESGESALDLLPSAQRVGIMQAVHEKGFGWLIPPSPLPSDTPLRDRELAISRRGPQPLRTFTESLELRGHAEHIPTTYVYCTDAGPIDSFGLSAARAKRRRGWHFQELAASHNPHITIPKAFAALIFSIASDRA